MEGLRNNTVQYVPGVLKISKALILSLEDYEKLAEDMHRICGGDFAGKLHLLMDYTDHPRDVADPWYTEDFESTWRDVLEGCQGLLRELLQE